MTFHGFALCGSLLSVLTLCPLLLGQAQSNIPEVRFHHVHYRVPDPGVAINDAATRAGGTRVIVQGVGVGVRLGDGEEYVLFERDSGEPGEHAAPTNAAHLYTESARWFNDRGIVAVPRLQDGPFSTAAIGVPPDHIGFAADDLDATLMALDRAGARPLTRTPDTAIFRLASGARVEIVRSTDRPDAFWCPMHADVRSADAGKCTLCGMDLVPIPPPRVGEYKMDVTVRDGIMRFVVRDPADGAPVRHFANLHERPFHLFVVSRDLTYFRHAHPELSDDGSLELRHALPSGEYMLIADFLPQGGTPQILQRAVVTPDYRGTLFRSPRPLNVDTSEKEVEGTRVRLDAADLAARRSATLRFTLDDAASGEPAADLEPFLGAAGHMLIVNADLTEAIHAHPEGQTVGGPSITFTPVLPAPGKYKLWAQFQRKGKVLTAAFAIEVRE